MTGVIWLHFTQSRSSLYPCNIIYIEPTVLTMSKHLQVRGTETGRNLEHNLNSRWTANCYDWMGWWGSRGNVLSGTRTLRAWLQQVMCLHMQLWLGMPQRDLPNVFGFILMPHTLYNEGVCGLPYFSQGVKKPLKQQSTSIWTVFIGNLGVFEALENLIPAVYYR